MSCFKAFGDFRHGGGCDDDRKRRRRHHGDDDGCGRRTKRDRDKRRHKHDCD
ncbi:MAG TPA: hypothetical protein VK735_38885 [Pseudonocardia sp.]|uniref:hypothetical protein n=1 Tax=Pseudonocardia sp. TaxID=60912 RepID=UPI002BE79AD4|nr:hypothetical protein [Pseudonocardia sp.]HTF53446.1 hypothetical protein [Pseudonocardia sp.]